MVVYVLVRDPQPPRPSPAPQRSRPEPGPTSTTHPGLFEPPPAAVDAPVDRLPLDPWSPEDDL